MVLISFYSRKKKLLVFPFDDSIDTLFYFAKLINDVVKQKFFFYKINDK